MISRHIGQVEGEQAKWLVNVFVAGPGMVSDENRKRLLCGDPRHDAILSLRAGDFEQAVAEELPSDWPFFACSTAMAHHHLGHAEKSLALLEQADGWWEDNWGDPAQPAPPSGAPLASWMLCYIVRREAHELILEPQLAERTKALEAEPKNAELYLNRARLHAMRGSKQAALADFTTAIELQPDLGAAWYHRGQLHAGRGRIEAALSDFAQALQTGFDPQAVYSARSDRCIQRGMWLEAAADLARLVELDPDDPLIWLRAAAVAALADPHEGYRAFCRDAVERFSGTTDFRIAECVIKGCLLVPEAVNLSALPREMLQRGLEDGTAHKHLGEWADATAALAACRAGDVEEAVRLLQGLEETSPNRGPRELPVRPVSPDTGQRHHGTIHGHFHACRTIPAGSA